MSTRVHIDLSEKRPSLPDHKDGMIHCEQVTITGYGLAGGGFGVYNFCDVCGQVVAKTIEDEDYNENT